MTHSTVEEYGTTGLSRLINLCIVSTLCQFTLITIFNQTLLIWNNHLPYKEAKVRPAMVAALQEEFGEWGMHGLKILKRPNKYSGYFSRICRQIQSFFTQNWRVFTILGLQFSIGGQISFDVFPIGLVGSYTIVYSYAKIIIILDILCFLLVQKRS